MESTANLGLFAVHTIVSEYEERIYARKWRRRQEPQNSVYNKTNFNFFLDSFYLHYIGWIKPKNYLTLLSL
jgi:hypothetical protein